MTISEEDIGIISYNVWHASDREQQNVKPSDYLGSAHRRMSPPVRSGDPGENGQAFQDPAIKENKMFDKNRLPWINDTLNLTLVIVVIAASVALYFIVVRGWSW
jgi:hypothetical protein